MKNDIYASTENKQKQNEKKRNKEDDRQEEKNPYYTYIIVC